jgi:excisionase family DNA binding protein
MNENQQNVTARVLSVQEAAEVLRVSPALVRKEIRSGNLGVRIGRLMRVSESELGRYLKTGESK